jgi:KipI family sensor histidine kinase inhibitor
MSTALQVADCGDAAVRVSCPTADREQAWHTVHTLGTWLDARRDLHHIRTAIATYDALLVEFDAEFTDHDTVRALVHSATTRSRPQPDRAPITFDVPVVYGGDHGPDLVRVAEQQGLDTDRVVAIHTEQALLMRCYGSPAGAPMLPSPVPRLPSPRPSVPAGAVAVAGRQAVVSARPAPGGWCVIGRTPRTLVDVNRRPLAAFSPGDAFRFFPIQPEEWSAYEGVLDA